MESSIINKRPSDHSGGLSVFHDVGDVQRSAQSYVATAAKRWMLRGRLPPTSHRSHPLPSGGCCQENLHRHPIVATAAKRWMLRGKSPPSGERWLRANGGYGRALEVRGKSPPSGERWLREGVGSCEENLHRLANGGYGRTVATGGRWLRECGGYGECLAVARIRRFRERQNLYDIAV
jgi:hypothetical protein